MKAFCAVVATAGLLIAVPALAQDSSGSGRGMTNIWSSAQGSSDSYGDGQGYSTSSSGSRGDAAGGHGTLRIGSGLTSAITTSNAVASTTGSGYVQTQTSGYAGGSIRSFTGRTH
jgi:hypothetical protein